VRHGGPVPDAGRVRAGDERRVLFNDRVERALTCASSYLECWTDPTGGGYVPLQIPAHPQAESPMQPLVGPTACRRRARSCATSRSRTRRPADRAVAVHGRPDESRAAVAAQAPGREVAARARPRLPRNRDRRERREGDHPRLLHAGRRETAVAVDRADGAGRFVGALRLEPPRYLALLPMFQRGRWKLTDGRDKEKQGASDERIFFYYHVSSRRRPPITKRARTS
jgi:hypothetical protein